MIIELDPASKEPPYTQLKMAIARLVASGALRTGERLPTIRQLAGDLDIAPNTVARAYRELEADGIVRSSGRRGTVIAAPPDHQNAAAAVAGDLDDLVQRARRLGLDPTTIVALVTESLTRPPRPAS